MSEYEPQVSVSDYINRPFLGKPKNVTGLQVTFTGIDTQMFQRKFCGGCPGCTVQPGTVFIVSPDIRGSKSDDAITLSVEGDTIEEARKKIRRSNCVKKTAAMGVVENKLSEHGLTR